MDRAESSPGEERCRREGIAERLYYAWSKEFLEAGKRRLAGDTARAATNGEVKELRREAQELKAVVAEQGKALARAEMKNVIRFEGHFSLQLWSMKLGTSLTFSSN